MVDAIYDIEVGLQTHLDATPNHPHIQWENDAEYKPAHGQRYWRYNHLPNRGELSTFNGMQKYQGFIQVDVFVPLGTGKADLMTDLNAIGNQFASGISIYSGDVRIDILDRQPGQAIREQSWYHGYIEIYYMCYSH